ncbi:MAG: response regulator transcription factor [Candidatus Promineifilaceae bacterium]
MQLLLLGSDRPELENLSHVIRRTRQEPQAVTEIEAALTTWEAHPPDAVVVIAGAFDRLDIVRRLRAIAAVPIILVTEPLDESGHIAALEAGYDLVLFRPYGVRLLSAQILAFLRRTSGFPTSGLPVLRTDEISLDPSTRIAHVEGREQRRLSHLEFRLLYVLMSHRGRSFFAEELASRVWEHEGEGDPEQVPKLVRRLRLKIEAEPSRPRFIQNVPGYGYNFVSE